MMMAGSLRMAMLLICPVIFLTGCQETQTHDPRQAPAFQPRADLPPGFTWHYEQGPDFYVYRALRDSDPAAAELGIYFGDHPGLREFAEQRMEQGNAFGYNIRCMTYSDADAWHYQTLLPFGRLTLHIWIYAQEHEDSAALLDSLHWARLVQSTDPYPPPPPLYRPATGPSRGRLPNPAPSETPAATRPANPLTASPND